MKTQVTVKTRYQAKPSYLCGNLHVAQGWHWWFSARAPDGADLVGVIKGPFATEELALSNARENGWVGYADYEVHA